MSAKPSIPKGTRDFTPHEMVRRNFIFDTIRQVFQKYGYLPIETPAMENLSSLLGKYGEEGDKLLFKVLNSGDFLTASGKLNINGTISESISSGSFSSLIAEKGLRYDLTVPFARFVVQHRNELSFPFKRYQIQPVWRADRPQKGRYREFYQCDVDVVGSNSLLYELELIQITWEVFGLLNVPVTIKINNRKILAGIAEAIGEPGKFVLITTAIDKLDKTGLDKVREELLEAGLTGESWNKLQPFLEMKKENKEKTETLTRLLADSATGMKGLQELTQLLDYLEQTEDDREVEFDLTLARGLHYYTGTIIEVKANNISIGSICGGGRYDDLTGIFGLPGVSGVGISFGADRIYDVMNESDLFPVNVSTSTKVLVVNFGEAEEGFALKLVKELRKQGIAAEIFPEPSPMKKQFSYAGNKKIPFVVIAGTDEISKGMITLKNMSTGEQQTLSLENILLRLTQA